MERNELIDVLMRCNENVLNWINTVITVVDPRRNPPPPPPIYEELLIQLRGILENYQKDLAGLIKPQDK
jgi:hypothetical protein